MKKNKKVFEREYLITALSDGFDFYFSKKMLSFFFTMILFYLFIFYTKNDDWSKSKPLIHLIIINILVVSFSHYSLKEAYFKTRSKCLLVLTYLTTTILIPLGFSLLLLELQLSSLIRIDHIMLCYFVISLATHTKFVSLINKQEKNNLQPINTEESERAKATFKNEKELIELKEVIENENVQTYKTEFAVRVGNKIKIIKTEATTCFYSEDNVTFLRSDNCNYIINEALLTLDSKLNSKQFYKVNRKFIINREAIENVMSYTNSRFKIELKNYNQAEIIVSRERSKDFKKWLKC